VGRVQTVPTPSIWTAVNVGGSESGQQSNYNAKGAKEHATREHRRVPVHDMGAPRSAFYLRLRQLPGMAVTTGGAEAQTRPAACSSTWC